MQRVISMRRLRTDNERHDLQQQMERAFRRQWGQPKQVVVIVHNREIWQPSADVYETDSALVVRIELPGMRDSEIEVALDERVLRVSGNRAEQRNERVRCYHQADINYGPFELEIFLSQPIDHDAVTASYDDGFLIVELPKPPHQERFAVPLAGQ